MPALCCKDKWPEIPDDEPVFVIRGQDLLALGAVSAWMEAARGAKVNLGKMIRVREHREAIERFQAEHPERCKIPD